MNNSKALNDRESWLAAEYALGVLSRSDMQKASDLYDNDPSFRECVDGWQNQLEPMLDEIEDVQPPNSLWNRIDRSVSPPVTKEVRSGDAGFWKLVTAFSSTVAVGCFALLMYLTDGDLSGREKENLKQQLAEAVQKSNQANEEVAEKQEILDSLQVRFSELNESVKTEREALTQARDALASNATQMQDLRQELEASKIELASVLEKIDASEPLVASLTQSGDAPAFLAQYDPLKQALLIRTSIADEDEKVPEIWLIPDQGDRKGEVLSLGVMDEAAPDVVKITTDFLPLIGEGGTLAITMEPPGGAPNGVATGPVIALGKLQAL